MYSHAVDLFPICRSITGDGLRETLAYLRNVLPGLQVLSIPSGTQVFDWTVPDEWNVRDAYVADEAGNRVIDFKEHNLHLVGYSEPVDCWLHLDELQERLHSLPDQPEAIPYVTSYYNRYWGFCLSENQRRALEPGMYHVVIDSSLEPGVLNYGELLLPGAEEEEILLSTYICHPSMANNELSGPVVTAALGRWLQELETRRYSYRILFVPETIGAIAYLSIHAQEMKRRTVAGYVVTCVGDDRAYSYLPSRRGDTLADRAARAALEHCTAGYTSYSFLERGSDERQFCSPLIDLPVASIMRTKYEEYEEYHTSLDDLSLISPQGLQGAYDVLATCLSMLERNHTYKATVPCEPQLGKRGLYPQLSKKDAASSARALLNILAYADGETDLFACSEITGLSFLQCADLTEILYKHGLLERI